MQEMVFRERQAAVAQLTAVGQMIARVYAVDADKAFTGIVAEYASEIFQETYDIEQLARRLSARRAAHAQIVAKRKHDQDMLTRLDRMGELGENYGKPAK